MIPATFLPLQPFNELIKRCPIWTLAFVCMAFLAGRPVQAEWGGSISMTGTDSRTDTVSNSAVDQQYHIYASGQPYSHLRYTGQMRYRTLFSDGNHTLPMRLTEVQPAASLAWSTVYYGINSNFSYRNQHDDQTSATFVGKSADVSFQSQIPKFPQLRGNYIWTKNLNDLDLIGQDTRLRSYTVGMNYMTRRTGISYDYSNSNTRSAGTTLERSSEQHIGRFDNTLQLFQKVVTLQTGYRIADRTEKEIRAASGDLLTPIPPVAGLYALDPSPELSTLEPLSSLIDGVTSVPVSPDITLSGADYHTFGLDFGTTADIDYLYLSTDTLGYSDLRWAVFTSEDNVSWTMARDWGRADFNNVFFRYEVSFPRQTSRYIKLAVEPILLPYAVHPTELRALIIRSDVNSPDRATDHQGNVELKVRPVRWLQAGVGGNILRSHEGLQNIDREQNGLHANLRLNAANWAVVSGSYQANQTRYPQNTESRFEGRTFGLNLESQWMPTLTTRTTASRTEEWIEGTHTRQNDAFTARAQAQWLPGLAGNSEFSYIENHRLDNGSIVWTRVYAQSIEAQPVQPVNIRAEYRYSVLRARDAIVPRFRDTFGLSLNWRMSRTLFVGGETNLFREPSRWTRSEDAQLSWTPTTKWVFGGGFSRTRALSEGASTLVSTFASFHWTLSTEITFAYYHTRYENAIQPATSSARLGFTTQF